eukprot:COSAG02_NODE_370_length_23672_cov_318.104738_5_plen_184_part_00
MQARVRVLGEQEHRLLLALGTRRAAMGPWKRSRTAHRSDSEASRLGLNLLLSNHCHWHRLVCYGLTSAPFVASGRRLWTRGAGSISSSEPLNVHFSIGIGHSHVKERNFLPLWPAPPREGGTRGVRRPHARRSLSRPRNDDPIRASALGCLGGLDTRAGGVHREAIHRDCLVLGALDRLPTAS